LRFLCFLLPLLIVPAFLNPGVTSRWLALSIGVPLVLLAYRSKDFAPSLPGIFWLLWASASMLWAVSIPDGAFRLWQFILFAAIFLIGTAMERHVYRQCLYAFALAIGVNLIVAVFQQFDILTREDLFYVTFEPAGMFVNANYLAEAAAIALVAMLALAHWTLSLVAIAAIALTLSKGAALSLAVVGLVYVWRRWPTWGAGLFFAGCVLTVAAVDWYGIHHETIWPRAALILNSFGSASFAGHGIGSYWSTYPLIHDAVMASPDSIYSFRYKPRTAHNDLATIVAELGVVGGLLSILFVWRVLTRWFAPDDREKRAAWWVLVAFLATGLVGFPLYNPATMMVGALTCGFLWNPLRKKEMPRPWPDFDTYWKVIFAAIGIWFAVASIFGEVWAFKGVKQFRAGNTVEAFLHLVRAEAVMPFRYYVREASASVHMTASTLPPAVNKAAVERALWADPYSGTLLWYLVVANLRTANLKEAKAALDRLEAVAEGWPQLDNAKKLYGAIEEKVNELKAKK
jgi:hypothetical protein